MFPYEKHTLTHLKTRTQHGIDRNDIDNVIITDCILRIGLAPSTLYLYSNIHHILFYTNTHHTHTHVYAQQIYGKHHIIITTHAHNLNNDIMVSYYLCFIGKEKKTWLR